MCLPNWPSSLQRKIIVEKLLIYHVKNNRMKKILALGKTTAYHKVKWSLPVPCCDVRCDFRITTMFYSSLPPVVVGGLLSYLSYLCFFAYSGAIKYTVYNKYSILIGQFLSMSMKIILESFTTTRHVLISGL
jgi:hypothetical protein